MPTAVSALLWSPSNSPVATEYPRYESSSSGDPSPVLAWSRTWARFWENTWPKHRNGTQLFKVIIKSKCWQANLLLSFSSFDPEEQRESISFLYFLQIAYEQVYAVEYAAIEMPHKISTKAEAAAEKFRIS